MQYRLWTAAQLPERIDFFPETVMERIRRHSGWVIAGINEKEEMVTFGVFLLSEQEPDVLELAWLYTIPEEREEGYAMGLLYYAEALFFRQGIRRFRCMLEGTREEILDASTVLELAEFDPLEQDWHVYSYDRKKLLESKPLQPFRNLPGKYFHHLDRAEIRYFSKEKKDNFSFRLKNGLFWNCDTEKSLFAVEKGQIVAAVLILQEDQKHLDVLNLYIFPEWKKKQQILVMLAQALEQLPECVSHVNLAVDEERLRVLYEYMFGVPETDYWVQRYEKELSAEQQ